MENTNNLEKYWQYRLAKVFWFAIIFLIGLLWLKTILYHNNSNWHMYSYQKFVINWHAFYHDDHYNSYYDLWKILKIFLEIFILIGSLVLATIFMQRIVYYVVYNQSICKCNKKENKKNKILELPQWTEDINNKNP